MALIVLAWGNLNACCAGWKLEIDRLKLASFPPFNPFAIVLFYIRSESTIKLTVQGMDNEPVAFIEIAQAFHLPDKLLFLDFSMSLCYNQRYRALRLVKATIERYSQNGNAQVGAFPGLQTWVKHAP